MEDSNDEGIFRSPEPQNLPPGVTTSEQSVAAEQARFDAAREQARNREPGGSDNSTGGQNDES